jgi:hypothetical protein
MKNIDAELIQAGYTQYPVSQTWERALFQKKTCNLKSEVLYFVNIVAYEFPVDPPECRYGVEVHLYKKLGQDPQAVLALQLSINDQVSLQDVEKEVASIYEKLGCIPDPHNN